MPTKVLTAEEQNLTRRAFMHGPAALFEEGLDKTGVLEFLDREEVREHYDLLSREFRHQEVMAAANRWGLGRQLTRLGDGAVAILANAMAGPEYARDQQGHIMTDVRGHPILREAEISPVQLRAAESVLDRLGVDQGKSQREKSAGLNADILFRQMQEVQVKIEEDPNLEKEAQQALSRERIRNVMEVMRDAVPNARARLMKELGYDDGKKNGKKSSKKKIKRPKKKLAKRPKKKS